MVLKIRPFRESDLPRCAELAMEVWPVVARFLRVQGGERFMRSYVEIILNPATWREVVIDADQVIGYLFGRVEKDASPWDAWYQRWHIVRMIIKVFLGRFGHLPNLLTFLRKLLRTEDNITRFSGLADGEILLFVVDPAYRGQGIGHALMDRFLQRARQAGAHRITLYTDPQSSWGFYERYGFRRFATLIDELDTYLAGTLIKGHIYALHIPK